MRVLALLCVLLCGICPTNAASHSLKYVYTAVTAGIDFREFTAVGLVDDEPFTYYDSKIRRAIPKTEWIKENVGEDYWGKNHDEALGQQHTLKTILIENLDQTQGVHTLQRMYGCEWDDETGATGGFDQFVYDGEDFITYDMENQRFIAPAQQASISVQKWNNDPALLEYRKQYLTLECVAWLKKYVSYRRSALERTVASEVSVMQKDSPSPGLTCHVSGFHARAIMVTWQRNGDDLDEDIKLGETVPNDDGTFQTASHLTVKLEDWKSQEYTCTVQHKSLKQDIVLSVKEENIKRNTDIKTYSFNPGGNPDGSSPPMGIIIGCVVGALILILILILAVIGVLFWKMRSSGYGKTSSCEKSRIPPEVSLLTVPNEDGTFQTRSHLRVKPEDWKSQEYTCTVQHKSMKQDIVLPVIEENIKRNSDIKNTDSESSRQSSTDSSGSDTPLLSLRSL